MKRHLLLFALLLLISGAMFGQLEVNPASLDGFTYDYGSGPSTALDFSVSGTSLPTNVTVAAPTGFEVSFSEGDNYSSNLTLTPVEGTLIDTTVYVRMVNGLTIGDHGGEINVTCGDDFSATVILNGSVNAIGTVELPTFNPGTGTYNAAQSVNISCPTDGASIFYSTASGNGPWIFYTGAITVNESMTIWAYASKEGYTDSTVTSATYTINIPEPELNVTPTSLEDFTYVFGYGPSNSKRVTVTGSNLNGNVTITVNTNDFQISLTEGGNFSSNLTLTPIEGTLTGTTVYVQMAAELEVGTYTGYINVNGGDGLSETVTLSGVVTQQPTVATPNISPEGSNYSEPLDVSISCDTEGAIIRYTTTGSEPTESSDTYTTPITINETTTVKAKAWKNGYQASATASANYTITYTIQVSANPEVVGGSAYVGNDPGSLQLDFNYGDTCTVHANPANDYSFVKWTENGTQVSTEANYHFRVDRSRNLVAHFVQQHTVTVLAAPEEGGNPYIGNNPGTTHATFTQGQSCTVHANPANGYTFQRWMENGQVVQGAGAHYTFTVTSNRNLVAHFSQNNYNISVSADPPEGGTVTGSGAFHYGETCTVSATANDGYEFTNWTENGQEVPDAGAVYHFTVTSNRNLVAHFTTLPPGTYSINVSANPNNGGAPYIGNTPGTTQDTFTSGQSCTVHANPANGYTFLRWTENGNQVSTNANYTFTVNENRNLVANFQEQTYTISVSADPTNGGAPYIGNTPGTTQRTFTHGQTCIVRANPNQDYTFQKWTENGSQASTNANYTFTVTSNRTLVAHFTAQAPNTYTITATTDPANGGSVTGGGTYEQGATCTLTATPNTNAGYEFVNWKKNGQQVSTNTTYSFPVTESAAYVAHFRLKSFTINVSADPSNGGTVSGGGTYNFGQSCTLSATPNSNYVFEKWTKNDTQVSDNPTYTFTVTGNASYVAHFKKKACTIKVSANPTNGGTVYIGNTPGTTQATYNYGETCIVHARANSGFTFINWTEDDYQVNTHADYSFTVEGDRTLVANFADASACIIYVDIEPEIGGTVTGAGVYSPGDVCTLKAFAKVGYEFKNWTINDVEVSTELSYTFTVTGTEYYVAHFEEKKYTITATSNNEDWGTVTGGGNYNYGGNCTLKATAKSGCTFSHWMKDDNTIIIENPYTFVVWDAASFTAIFELESTQQYTITATANPEEGGTVTGGGTYASGVTCKLKATPNTGYTFINWTEDGTAVSSNATYTFPVTNDRNLIANFEKDEVPCIENDKIQKIVPKDHTEDNETYTLILVYPNPDEEYVYQWCYAPETDSLHYRDLNVNDGTYNKQYFYRGGALLKGYYKVRISKEKEGCSPVETEPHHVTYKHATQLRIYPNPSRRDHNIVVVNDSDGPSQLSIYSTDGRLLHAQTVTDNQTTLNLNLPSGVYIAYLTDSDGYTKIGKLVIQ